MSVPRTEILPLLGAIGRRLEDDVSLAALARIARRSPFELHRAFVDVTGETTKRYTQRLRLDRAAVQLVATRDSILEIALASGFASHEVFTRAFVRRFHMSPRSYRARGLRGGARAIAAKHAATISNAGPCIGLHHFTPVSRSSEMSTTTVTVRTLDPRPALVVRRKIAASEIAKTLGECLGRIVMYAQRNAIPLAGQPFTRYLQTGRGLLTVEAGMPIGASASGEGDIAVVELPGGPAAVAVHVGAYDRLTETHLAVERWIDANQRTAAGAPWEVYVTDPAHKPDPATWETEVIYPLR